MKNNEKIIQFGEGVFLRGFADWMLQKLNDSGLFDGSAVIVQPLREGRCDELREQGCEYHHIIRGSEGVETTLINVISRCINPYEEFSEFLKLAENPDMRFIISNTTEAGIEYKEEDKKDDAPPSSFPAKLTLLLYKRFCLKLKGFVLLPCELIEDNGKRLKECVIKYALKWGLGEDFIDWLNRGNSFCRTLVDRIVTGFPKEEKFDFEDNMLDTSEYFHLWVIEGDKKLFDELPFDKAGLNVIITDNLSKYRTRKVRILNGAHTAMVPYAMLRGFETVKECMDNKDIRSFAESCVYDEIIPTLDLPKEELLQYSDDVFTRFSNPYIKHYLSAISLNSVSKFKVRVLPSLLTYKERFNKTPAKLTEAFGNLIRLYKSGMGNDSEEIIEFMKEAPLDKILSSEELWGQDLSFLYDEVKKYVD